MERQLTQQQKNIKLYSDIDLNLFKTNSFKNEQNNNNIRTYKLNYNDKGNETLINVIILKDEYTLTITIPKNNKSTAYDYNNCLKLTIDKRDKSPYINNVNQYNCFDYQTITPYFKIIYTFLMKFNYYDEIQLLDLSKKNNIIILPIRLLVNQGSIYSRFGFNFDFQLTNDRIINTIKNFKLPYSKYTIEYYTTHILNPKDLYNNNTILLYKYIKYYIIKKYNHNNIIDEYYVILYEYYTTLTNVNNSKITKFENAMIQKNIISLNIFMNKILRLKYNNQQNVSKNNLQKNIANELNNNLTLHNNITKINKLNAIELVNRNINRYIENNIFYHIEKEYNIYKSTNKISTNVSSQIEEITSSYIYGEFYIDGHMTCKSIQNAMIQLNKNNII